MLDGSTVEKRAIRDFYGTFPFAQGMNPLHKIQFAHIASFYTQEESHLIINSPYLRQEAITLYMPNPSHSIIIQAPPEQFASRWEDFVATIAFRKDHPNFSKDLSAYQFGQLFLERDIHYVLVGRKALPTSTPYESFLRTYGLNERPTGSPSLNDLFSRLKRICSSLRGENLDFDSELIQDWVKNPYRKAALDQELTKLEKLWEQKHPGEKFFLP